MNPCGDPGTCVQGDRNMDSVGEEIELWPAWFHSENHKGVQEPVARKAGVKRYAAEAARPRCPGMRPSLGSLVLQTTYGEHMKQLGLNQRGMHSGTH